MKCSEWNIMALIRKYSWFLVFLTGPLFVGAFSVAGWIMYGGTTRDAMRIEYVIPAGTAERVEAGESVASLPSNWVFIVGDVLVLRNEDDVNHQLGPFWAPAGSTLTIPMESASKFNYLCTIHPSGSIDLQIQPRNSWVRPLTITLLLGIPIGAVISLAVYVASRLDSAPTGKS